MTNRDRQDRQDRRRRQRRRRILAAAAYASRNRVMGSVTGTGFEEGTQMTAPVDPTTTTAWSRLLELREEFTPDLRGWFAADPERVARMTLTAGDLHVDLSKNLVTDACLLYTSRCV